MRVGIIGSGMIGATVARLLAGAGHEITIANSRGPESLGALVDEIGPNARAGSTEEAIDSADVVLLAIPFGRYAELPKAPFAGKVVIDATNYYPDRDGSISELEDGSMTSTEIIARHLDGARVVKAFNTMYFQTLATAGHVGAPRDERHALLVCGDDASAKAIVAQLIDDIGFAAVDTGSSSDGGRHQQPGSPLYNNQLTAPQAEAHLREARP
jgi:8-hydroxy-5-deazaflavin:NADPH oxidoreductase